MKRYLRNAGFLLSLALPTPTLGDPFPSAVDAGSLADLRIRSADESPMMMADAMHRLQKYDTIYSLVKRSFSEMGNSNAQLFRRQIITTDPKTGNAGSGTFDTKAWDKQVNAACSMPIEKLSGTITTITDPAGVAVCYNIPYYNVSTGEFESDIRLYKIANGTSDWAAAGTKISLSVRYEGAQVQLAEAPNEEGVDIVVSDAVANAMVMTPHPPPSVKDAAAALDRGAKAAAKEKKIEFIGFLAAEAEEAEVRKAEKASLASKAKAAPTGKPAVAADAAKPAPKPASSSSNPAPAPAASKPAPSAAQPSTTAKPAAPAGAAAKAVAPKKGKASWSAIPNSSADPAPAAAPSGVPKKNKRDVHMMSAIKALPQRPGSFTPHLLQALRFIGKVNPGIMANETIRKDPAIMKLVLTPSLMLVGGAANGGLMNTSVAGAQVQYVTGAFSNITSPVPPVPPFVLPGTFIAIFPAGLYLVSAYTGLFLLIVGAGTVERYLFRMSFRKRSAMLNGTDGFGKI
ncbi:hypothetical protein Dda_7198 [Drechslerella dactyloides]|uniref:Uncharacterized protein n=1 Tax=Drechslerella dactyloides TaxID=74499 RepID=A0AAD6NIT9_DREDA|nr:hypothetical protein Dda_7198 [Drechslerella dactyloides]